MSDKLLPIPKSKMEIIANPENYFIEEVKNLDARLDSILLSSDDEEEIIKDHSKKFLKEKFLSLSKIGSVINEIINWNESIDKDIKEAKKEVLLSQYFSKCDNNTQAIQELKYFLTNPAGNTLFNKIMYMLDNTPPDIELSHHLSNALIEIINSDFQSLFEKHKYALSQIEQLTPQALTILADYQEYPIINLGGYSVVGGKFTSDWSAEFTQAYANSKMIIDSNIKLRIRNSINELINKRILEAHLFEKGKAKCNVTLLGQELLPYIENS